jgi:rubredoxin
MPNWNSLELYPALIYSWDIATITKSIENLVQEELESIDTLFELINDSIETNNRTIDCPLNNPFQPFPYYEGMNKMSTDKYWLGLYWRNNNYDLPFLLALCELCAQSKIGKICITPWKSFIIKGIPVESKLKWEKCLGNHGINIRHSQLELNWHLPVGDPKALKLKNYLVSKLDSYDISTYGLTIGISMDSSKVIHFTSIVIQRNPPALDQAHLKLRATYNLRFAKNFDPNTRVYITYAMDIDKMELPGLLMELSKQYFQGLDELVEDSEKVIKVANTPQAKPLSDRTVYQCSDCLTVYDQNYGDPSQNIAKNTPFELLAETYHCCLCEAPKSNFKPIQQPRITTN